MGFALLLIGLLMIIVGARGTYVQFGEQLTSEFTGENNFTYWIVALGAIGALGYIPAVQKLSRMLMTLVILVLFLSHKGFFEQFQTALKSGPVPPKPLPETAGTGGAPAGPALTGPGLTGQSNAIGSNITTGTPGSWLKWLDDMRTKLGTSNFNIFTPAQ